MKYKVAENGNIQVKYLKISVYFITGSQKSDTKMKSCTANKFRSNILVFSVLDYCICVGIDPETATSVNP